MIFMKKTALILMCGILLLSGCQSTEQEETTTSAATIATPEQVEESIEEAITEYPDYSPAIEPESELFEDMYGSEYEFRPDKEMPHAFIPDQCYADYNAAYYNPLNPLISNIPAEFIELIGEEEFDEWRSKAENDDEIYTDLNDIFGIYSFIHNTSVPKDKAEEILLKQMEFWDEMEIKPNFTPEGITAIIQGDKEKVIELYKHKSAIYINGKLISPRWLYEKPLSEWRREGITLDMINSVYADIMTLPFSLEGAVAFKAKVEYYCTNYSSECK